VTEFTPFLSASGGALIGAAAVLLMALHGRIAGMTGILSGIIPPLASDWAWRAAFLAGAIAAPVVIGLVSGEPVSFHSPMPVTALIGGGLVVGVGVTLGGGCTSGHGVCGLARLSPRSIVATLTFMSATVLTVFVIRHVLGGV